MSGEAKQLKARQRRGGVGEEAGEVGDDGILRALGGYIGDFGLCY